MNLAESHPCNQRCPICNERCYGKEGHAFIRTAGRGYAQPHQCRQHFWGTGAEWVEITRAEGIASRREVVESIKKCAKCVRAVEKLGV